MTTNSRTRGTPRFAAALASAVALLGAACSDMSSPTTSPMASVSSTASTVSASDFTILANQAITCTDGVIAGDIGTFQASPTGSITQTSCALSGEAHVGDGASVAAYNAFLAEYAALAPQT